MRDARRTLFSFIGPDTLLVRNRWCSTLFCMAAEDFELTNTMRRGAGGTILLLLSCSGTQLTVPESMHHSIGLWAR